MRPMHVVWDQITRADWRGFAPENCALQQSWPYGEAVRRMGAQLRRAVVMEDGACIGIAQVLVRDFRLGTCALISRGPIWRSDVSTETKRAGLRMLRRSLPGSGVKLLLHTGAQDLSAGIPLISPAHLAVLDLSTNQDALRRGLHGKWRNRLVRAESSGLDLRNRAAAFASIADLIARDQAQQRRKGFRNLPPEFLHAWDARGGKMRLFEARHNGECLAAMLFVDHAPGVSYQIGWTSQAGRENSAHHLLLWSAICHFSRKGHRQLDLGLLDTNSAPGLARFKLGAGAKVLKLAPTRLIATGWGDVLARPYAAAITRTGTAL